MCVRVVGGRCSLFPFCRQSFRLSTKTERCHLYYDASDIKRALVCVFAYHADDGDDDNDDDADDDDGVGVRRLTSGSRRFMSPK